MKISIRKDTKQRINAFAAYTDENGTRYPTVPPEVFEWVEPPAPPAEYLANPSHYTVAEVDAAPYVVYTRKDDDQIAEATLALFDAALTQHLDATAQARKYDNRITCMVRAGFPGPFQAEAIAFATWCDNCNWHAYQVLAGVQEGTLPMPASVAEFLADMPPMVWPTN